VREAMLEGGRALQLARNARLATFGAGHMRMVIKLVMRCNRGFMVMRMVIRMVIKLVMSCIEDLWSSEWSS